MTAFRLQGFRGLIPRLSNRLLPDTAAVTASNTKLLSGELRGYNMPQEFDDFTLETFTVAKAHRIEYDDYGSPASAWVLFNNKNADVVRSPVLNDVFDRYYWAAEPGTIGSTSSSAADSSVTRPMYNTRNRIVTGLGAHFLGVPKPSSAVALAGTAGGSTRAYVYTFVSEYGEEGPPSNPTLGTFSATASWTLTGFDTTVPDAANRPKFTKRIYRTVPGNATSSFFFVAEIPLTDTIFVDNVSDVTAASNNLLESTRWFEPPSSMVGFVAMPNGYLVGWAGRRLLFSEPYRPHAWPPQYELGTEYEIMGLAVWGDLLVIGTRSSPYVGQGVSPGNFFMRKIGQVEPCLSRRGIVSSVNGVYYPSLNGLALVNNTGLRIITRDLVTKQEWDDFSPSTLYAAQLGEQYLAFSDTNTGFVYDPSEVNQPLVTFDAFVEVNGIETDPYDGTVTLVAMDRAWEWDPANGEPIPWRWKSKEFRVPKPFNLGIAKLHFNTDTIFVGDAIDALFGAYNDARFVTPLPSLDTLCGHALCAGTQNGGQVASTTVEETRMPLGGGPLFPIDFFSSIVPSIRLMVYADGVLVFDHTIFDEKQFRLPSGFKADVWQFEMVGNTQLYLLEAAGTAKELSVV